MKDVNLMSQQELRNELRDTRGLLAAANCPNRDCVQGLMMGRLAEMPQRCQWCLDRSALIGVADANS